MFGEMNFRDCIYGALFTGAITVVALIICALQDWLEKWWDDTFIPIDEQIAKIREMALADSKVVLTSPNPEATEVLRPYRERAVDLHLRLARLAAEPNPPFAKVQQLIEEWEAAFQGSRGLIGSPCHAKRLARLIQRRRRLELRANAK